MDQVYTFDKCLEQRLREYGDVLSGFEVLPASRIMREWSYYIELTIDPNGWQAVWKISRTTCEFLKIPFPTIVLVFVLDVDCSNLQALVSILAVQDDIHISEKHYVPLIQLWPTKTQDKSVALNLSSTANVLDMFRFFYLNLFMPWDLEDEDNADWRTKHLESRLRLYYDMINGVIPKSTSIRINSLFTEARRLQHKRESIELELEDTDIDQDSNQKLVDMLTEIHLRLLEIKGEVEILENPLLRKALLKRQEQFCEVDDSRETRIWLIHEEGSLTNYIKFLEQVKHLYPNGELPDKVTVHPSLSSTLENGGPNDTFILSDGTYDMNVLGALEKGGILKGVTSKDKTILVSSLEDVTFDFQVSEALVESVTIDATVSQCAIVIRKGKVTFSNCRIFCHGTSSTHQGIIVLAGGELVLQNCEIYGFYTAIVGNSGSKITMQNTEIHDVHNGLKIYDNSFLNLRKCLFRDCIEYGIVIDTQNNLDGDTHKVGDFDVLNIIPEITTEFVNGKNNKRGDVIINHPSQISAIEDLFSYRDPTVPGAPSEEEMLTESSKNGEVDNISNGRNMSPATI